MREKAKNIINKWISSGKKDSSGKQGAASPEQDDCFKEFTPIPLNEKTLPSILILTPVKDAERFLPQYVENLYSLSYPHDKISLGFLEGDSEDRTFERLEERLGELNQDFKSAKLFKKDFALTFDKPRWHSSIQYQRRSIMAKSRNILLQQALTDEMWVLWIDVDVSSYPQDVIQQLLSTNKDIVVPNCVFEPGGKTFDLNTFQLKSDFRLEESRQYLIDNILQPPKGFGRLYLEDLRDYKLVKVDCVGGTMLLVKAGIHREGLVFPTFSYKHYIETEGLAIMAKDMGYTAWGLPQLEIVHGAH